MTDQPRGATAVWQPESPFTSDPQPAPAAAVAVSREAITGSPFLDEYLLGERLISQSVEAEEFGMLLEELRDPSFDAVLYQLAEDAAAAGGDVALTQGEVEPGRNVAQFIEAYLDPLRVEAEVMFDQFAGNVGDVHLAELTESELDGILEKLEPGDPSGNQLFDDFLGGLVKKVKKAAKSVWKKAKKIASKVIPIKAILSKVKKLVRPLLKKVLKFAINKLPPYIRPLAGKLAKRILGETPAPEDRGLATADVSVIQEQFDLELASVVHASSDIEGELVVAEAEQFSETAHDDSVARYQAAREQFIQEISSLSDGEDPAPAIERFLPAVLPMVRLGIKLIGRRKVVNFLAKFLARLISRYVGRSNARNLSRAIVDTGLRLLRLEVGEQDEAELAGAAIASTVEETVRFVAELDEAYLDDEAMLEVGATEAFERAVARNFPPDLLKPHVRPLGRVVGTWIAVPRRGKAIHKRFSKPLRTVITPQVARRIKAGGGASLHSFLKETYGIDWPVEAEAHLFEAMVGARPALVARSEEQVNGLGNAGPLTWKALHPLTEETAAILFGEPELGSPQSATSSGSALPVGQRLFYLELAGATPAPRKSPTVAAASRVAIELNTIAGQINAQLSLTESDSQAAAQAVARGEPSRQVIARIINSLDDSIADVISGRRAERLKLVVGRPSIRDSVMERYRSLAPKLVGLRRGITGWMVDALAADPRFAEDLAAAAGDGRDGSTVRISLSGVGGLDALRRHLDGTAVNGAFPAVTDPTSSTVDVQAGRAA